MAVAFARDCQIESQHRYTRDELRQRHLPQVRVLKRAQHAVVGGIAHNKAENAAGLIDALRSSTVFRSILLLVGLRVYLLSVAGLASGRDTASSSRRDFQGERWGYARLATAHDLFWLC